MKVPDLHDLELAGVHGWKGDMHPVVTAAAAAKLRCHAADLRSVANKSEMLAALAKGLALPEHFGDNWDALADCLGDLSWMPADGYLILLEHCDGFRAGDGGDFTMALQVFAAASEAWRGVRVPFWVLVDMHADGIACLPGLD